jgi:hypothetical protein
MRRKMLFAVLLAIAGLVGGCVEREITLVTEPQGAKAYYNEKYIGETPVSFHFTYYQSSKVRFEKDGYDTLTAIQPVKPPVYERFPLDLVTESGPWTVYDKHTYTFQMKASTPVDVNELATRAAELGAETTAPEPKTSPAK